MRRMKCAIHNTILTGIRVFVIRLMYLNRKRKNQKKTKTRNEITFKRNENKYDRLEGTYLTHAKANKRVLNLSWSGTPFYFQPLQRNGRQRKSYRAKFPGVPIRIFNARPIARIQIKRVFTRNEWASGDGNRSLEIQRCATRITPSTGT